MLKKELDFIYSTIRQLNEITKSIKNWTISIWTASVMCIIANRHLHIYMVNRCGSILFWFVDASYRRIQRTFIVRHGDIADYVNSDSLLDLIQKNAPLDFRLLEMRNKRKYLIKE